MGYIFIIIYKTDLNTDLKGGVMEGMNLTNHCGRGQAGQ